MKERKSNIELLRILCIIGVIILHYNNKTIGGALEYVSNGSLNFYILNILESICIISVNVFVIISGLFLYNSEKRNIWKVIKLLIFVVVIFELKYFLSSFINKTPISIYEVIIRLLPKNYFVILYVVLYILSPYINILIKSLNKNQFKRFVIIVLVLFSIYPTCIDFLSEITKKQYNGLSTIGLYGSQYGYTSVNFVLCYIIGAYISRFKDILKNEKFIKLIGIFVINVIIITIWSLFNDYTGYYIEKSALEYCNPLIIVNAAILVLIFKKIKIDANGIINRLAKESFTVFLIHDIFMNKLNIENFVNKNTIIMLLHIIVCSIAIYVVGYIVFIIYSFAEKLVFKFFENKFNMTYEIKKMENISE